MSLSQLQQHTIATAATISGVVVHSGAHVRVTLLPAPAGSGIVFVRADVPDRDNRIPATCECVEPALLNTRIVNDAGVSVSTIEHLMAALSAMGIDNVLVELDGPECPIMDGSALPFVTLIERAGRRPQAAARSVIEVLEPVEVTLGDKRAAFRPSEAFEVDFELVYASPAIGRQRIDLVVTEESFRTELAAARTFGFMHEVEQLRAAGLARGGSLDNAVVIDNDVVINPGGLRMEREFVRHKALDAVGDLYTLGAPLLGRFESVRGGHALTNTACRALLARPSAWRLHTIAPELALAV